MPVDTRTITLDAAIARLQAIRAAGAPGHAIISASMLVDQLITSEIGAGAGYGGRPGAVAEEIETTYTERLIRDIEFDGVEVVLKTAEAPLNHKAAIRFHRR